MQGSDFDIAIAGAGIVGVSCALWAQMRGLKVMLADGNAPGSGTSSGNAGTIATYACVPVNSPSIVSGLPFYLFSKESPLGFDWRHALTNMPWMISFLRNCSKDRVRTISDHLGDLLSHADAGLDPLIEAAGAEDLMVSNDCLYVWSTQAGYEGAKVSNEARRRNGVAFDLLSADDIRGLEPALQMPLHKGLLYKGARHVRDPLALTERLHAKFVAMGGTWVQQDVTNTEADPAGVTLNLANGSTVRAGKFVVAAGAHSKAIKGSGAASTPLDTERGHHLLYKDHGHLISRPVGWADAGFYAVPMDPGLRVAGTVELAGLTKPKSKGRLAYLARKAHEMFGDIGTPDEDWLGFRPTFPDALPAIGPSPKSANILYAFGHQHIGLTLAGITGRIIADMAEGRAPNFDVSPFDPKRFG
ncbi:MAG: FAD-binding oxidoreductase [Alphaproteobacteria bacterium]|nr:FAD-binding oxidoreductase [Alphaproteobacteria bacterium]